MDEQNQNHTIQLNYQKDISLKYSHTDTNVLKHCRHKQTVKFYYVLV